MGKIGKTSAYRTLDFFFGGLPIYNFQLCYSIHVTTENHNQKFESINFMFVHYIVYYIDKVELLISVLLPVKI